MSSEIAAEPDQSISKFVEHCKVGGAYLIAGGVPGRAAVPLPLSRRVIQEGAPDICQVTGVIAPVVYRV